MRTRSLLLLPALFLGSPTIAEDEIYIRANETEALEAKEGQEVVVYGKTADSGKSSSGTNFVNFEGSEFYLVTFKSDLGLFPDGEPADLFDGKRLAVTGVVSIYRDKPQIKLTAPDQVRILAEDEVFPPKQDSPPPATAETRAKEAPEKKPEPKPEAESEKRKPPVDASEFFK